MKFKFIGCSTGAVYAQGDEAECNRILINKFPSNPGSKRRDHDLKKSQMLPERIVKQRVED